VSHPYKTKGKIIVLYILINLIYEPNLPTTQFVSRRNSKAYEFQREVIGLLLVTRRFGTAHVTLFTVDIKTCGSKPLVHLRHSAADCNVASTQKNAQLSTKFSSMK
jgi:hypothetical protein